MKTFAFDESGIFENDNRVSFVAGFIYDDMGDPSDAINERNRIECFYKTVMQKTGLKGLEYPKSLHLSNNCNHRHVYQVKSAINECLIGFIKGTGNQCFGKNLPKRKGKYHLYVMYKGASTVQNLSERDNMYTDESFANNLYFHMVDKLLTIAVFENIDNVEDTRYQLIVPTRSIRVEADSQKYSEFKKTGYWSYKNGKDEPIRFAVMDKVSYNALFQEKTRAYDLDFETKVGDYHYDSKGDPFFFLADSICTFISSQKDNSDIGKIISVLPKDQSTIILYNSEKLKPFSLAVKRYMQRDFFAMFSHMYTIEQMKDDSSNPIVDYYKTVLFPRMYNAAKKTDFVYWKETVRKLNDKIMTNRYNSHRGVYIFEKIRGYVDQLNADQTVDKKSFFDFYKSGISVYNHQAASEKALECFKECLSYGTTTDLVPLFNRYIVALCDGFEWDKAEKVAIVQVNNCLQLNQMKQDISSLPINQSDITNMDDLAKAYSQYAQILAFERKSEEAACYFDMALKCYSEPSANYYITLSYYLHYLIDARRKDLYDKWAPKYFGGKTSVLKQLKVILSDSEKSNPERSFPFAMYIFIKGVYAFYIDSMLSEDTERMLNKLKPVIGKLQSDSKDSHPNQFILCYYILLLLKIQKSCEEELESLSEMALRSTDGGLLSAIKFYCLIRCQKEKGMRPEDPRQIQAYKKMRSAIKSIPKFSTLELEENRAIDKFADSYLTYMYC